METVRVRFAPSPTGELHIGGLRTALFNYLYARRHGGVFILRIEDTDRTRYVPEAELRLMEMLKWAGIAPDEGPQVGGPHGPYHQSERLPMYRQAAEELMAKGLAYPCYCSSETLDQMRQQQQARGMPTRYDGRCRKLTPDDRKRLDDKGLTPVVRMVLPDREERMVVKDLIRGNVAFNTSQLDDQVLLKSDGFPTYHLAVVVDDHAMEITHVLRAEEWLPSTPKHLLLYRYLGWEPPQYAHLPLLLNDDRSKMSKRKGDVSVEAYQAKGYLPEALVNFIALLGWSPGDDREVFTLEELVQEFSIERINKTGAVFNRDKLDWMNQQYMSRLPVERLVALARPFFPDLSVLERNHDLVVRAAGVVQPSLVTLADLPSQLELFLKDPQAPLAPEVDQTLAKDEVRRLAGSMATHLGAVNPWGAKGFQEAMKTVQKETGLKGRDLWIPARMVITRAGEGPELPLVVEALGRDLTLERIRQAAQG
ncbi:MAG: glutamate--tRNA ligase [Deltaproteobacteria bacterium]|nr:glutamate--tRNA ligase [Deltaproteobacteria bacterium]